MAGTQLLPCHSAAERLLVHNPRCRPACCSQVVLPSCMLAGSSKQHGSQAAWLHSVSQLPLPSSPAAQRGSRLLTRVATADPPGSMFAPVREDTVGNVMTRGHIHKATLHTTIDEALELLVNHRVTGLPVVDEDNRVVGVVSDYDLLSLDDVSGKMKATGLFPDTNTEWTAFQEIQKLMVKNSGRTVADVMTPEPLTVRPETCVEAAARILLERKVRRMPVVDETGRLVGMFTRGDVIRVALEARRLRAGRS